MLEHEKRAKKHQERLIQEGKMVLQQSLSQLCIRIKASVSRENSLRLSPYSPYSDNTPPLSPLSPLISSPFSLSRSPSVISNSGGIKIQPQPISPRPMSPNTKKMSREETFFLLAFGMPMSLGGIASSERPERKVNLFAEAEKSRKKSIEARKAKVAEEEAAAAAAKLSQPQEEEVEVVQQKQKSKVAATKKKKGAPSSSPNNQNSNEGGPPRLRPPLVQPQQYSLESEGYHSGREEDISDRADHRNVDEAKITRSSPNVNGGSTKIRKSEIIMGTKGQPEIIIEVKNDPIWGPTYIRRPKSKSPRYGASGPVAEVQEVTQESTTTSSLDHRPSSSGVGSKSPRRSAESEIIEEQPYLSTTTLKAMDRKPSPSSCIGSKSPARSGSRLGSRSPIRLGSEDIEEAIPDLATSSTCETPARSSFEVVDTSGIPDLTSSSPTREPSPRVGFALDMIVETIPELRTSSPPTQDQEGQQRQSRSRTRRNNVHDLVDDTSPAAHHRGPSPRVGFAEIVEAIPGDDVRKSKSPLPREPSPHPTSLSRKGSSSSRKGSTSGWPSYARPTSSSPIRSKSKSIEIVETIPDGRVWPDPGAYSTRGPAPMLQPHSQMIEARPKPPPLGSDARKFSREESFFLLAFGMPMAVEPSCTMDHGK